MCRTGRVDIICRTRASATGVRASPAAIASYCRRVWSGSGSYAAYKCTRWNVESAGDDILVFEAPVRTSARVIFYFFFVKFAHVSVASAGLSEKNLPFHNSQFATIYTSTGFEIVIKILLNIVRQ